MTSFTVVDSPSSYNIILGRPAMNELRVVASTYHQKIKFPVGARVGEVRGDQSKSKKEGKKARMDEVGVIMVEKGEVHFVAEEEQEMVEVGPGQQIRVARDLSASTRELTGISPLISEHQLNILPGSHPIKQKKRHFGPEKDRIIDEQVKELLKAGHVREIQFHTWLSNVNAGATYQRLMNKVFEKQLGRNVEVYVDFIWAQSSAAIQDWRGR
ncbi:uncharacterized protein, partial [Primulina huaijiensis]|uniref:uncharacterized protein n=1 Tax=Primulina huaijiensis TaxID=1492673 RepID=UPI003CC76A64